MVTRTTTNTYMEDGRAKTSHTAVALLWGAITRSARDMYSMIKNLFRPERLQPDTMVGTSRQILAGEPLTAVIHQNDGTWQFQCDSPKIEADARVVHFHDIVNLDSGVLRLTKLPKGTVAIREPRGEWRRLYFNTDTETSFSDQLSPSLQRINLDSPTLGHELPQPKMDGRRDPLGNGYARGSGSRLRTQIAGSRAYLRIL